MLTKIEVTQKDIDEATPCLTRLCPVARAIKRHLKDEYYCRVLPSMVFFCAVYTDGEALLVRTGGSRGLPPNVRSFVDHYDLGFDTQPFSFPLDIPDELLKEIHHVPESH